MKADARELDQLVRDWWLTRKDDKLFEKILNRALTGEPTSLIPFARAIQILETQKLGPGLQKRVEDLGQRLDKLRFRETQVDKLGDLNNEPEALFEVLNKDVATLQGFDPDALRRARLPYHQGSRGAAACAFLEALGWERLDSDVATALREAVDDVVEREQQEAWGLFVVRSDNKGLALGVKLVVDDSDHELFSDADTEMREQAHIAAKFALKGRGWEAKIEWPAQFSGESIGLPLYIAALVANNALPRHALTASTGRLEIDGRVTGVVGIEAKLEAARRLGILRVLLPRENIDEAKAGSGGELIIVPIEHVRDVEQVLQQPIPGIALGYSGLIPLVRASLHDFQLALRDESSTPQGFRFMVANATGNANIWVHTTGLVRADGPAGPALDAAIRLISERVPSAPEPRETISFQLPTPSLQERFRNVLRDLRATADIALDYEAWRMRITRGRSRAAVILYNSGKCVLQGTAPAWDEALAAAKQVTREIGGLSTSKPTSTTLPPRQDTAGDDSEPHIGTDEAGKGDYFGPLVSAAVFVDRESAARLRELGVRDSKTLSDRRVRELADQIRSIDDIRYAVTAINPRKFNELYDQFRKEEKNLNSLLAWGHARSIDNILSLPAGRRVNAKYVVVDQFGDKHYIEERTRRAGIPIHQRHKAEEDIAVAAASVLAREGFLQWLRRWSERTGILLPKGASSQVVAVAKQFVRQWGAECLGEVAKLNFRTTREVLEGEDINAAKLPPPWISEPSDSTGEG
jgi:ribonuclease HIII